MITSTKDGAVKMKVVHKTEGNKGGKSDIWSFLSDCGVSLDDLKDPEIMGRLDNSQIFLLKTAFKSLENFSLY